MTETDITIWGKYGGLYAQKVSTAFSVLKPCEKCLMKAEDEGYNEGYVAGAKDGFEQGYDDAITDNFEERTDDGETNNE